MFTTNVTNARSNLYNIIARVIKNNEPVNIISKNGNAVIISKGDYNSLIETLYLSSNSSLKKILLEGKNTSMDKCIDESEVNW